jgi:hypothetical protein
MDCLRILWLLRHLVVSWLACVLAQPALAVTVDDIIYPYGTQSAALSPDGRHAAVVVFTHAGVQVQLVDTTAMKSREFLSVGSDILGRVPVATRPRSVLWLTNDWLVVRYLSTAQVMDLSGRTVARLNARVMGKAVPADPASTLVLLDESQDKPACSLVDVRSSRRTPCPMPPGDKLVDWTFDELGQLREAVMASDSFWNRHTRLTRWYRPAGSPGWKLMATFNTGEETWWAVQADSQRDELIVRSREGRDTWAIFRYDALKGERGDMLFGDEAEDVAV